MTIYYFWDDWYWFHRISNILKKDTALPGGTAALTPMRTTLKAHLIAWFTSGFV